MTSCPGCQKAFKTEAALYSHQRQTKKTRCRRFYASSSHGSQPSDIDHISDHDFGFESSSEARIPTEPNGDYFGSYDDHAPWAAAASSPPPLSPTFSFDFNPPPTSIDSDNDPNDLEIDATALDREVGWELNLENVHHRHPSRSLSTSPDLLFTPSPLSPQSASLPSSRSSSLDSDNETDDLEFAATALECEGGWEPNAENVHLHDPSRFLSASPDLLFAPSPLSSRSASLPSSRSSSPPMAISEVDDEEPVFANLTPYRRLFYNNPFIVPFPNPVAGTPVNNLNHQQSMNEVYRRQLDGSHETHNLYTPFSSEVDWEVARWAKLRGPTSTAFSDLLNIPGVCGF